MKKCLLPLIALLLLSGCASVPKASKEQDSQAKTFSPKKGMASIYVFSESGFVDSGAIWDLKLDGITVGGFTNGNYIQLEIPTGTHSISTEMRDSLPRYHNYLTSSLDVNVQAGDVYIFQQGRHTEIEEKEENRGHLLHRVDETTGKTEVSKCSLISLPENVLRAITPEAIAAATKRRQATAIQPNFVSPDKIIAPRPIAGSNGSYKSPFTSAGGIAPWAQERKTEMDNGSDLAASAGGAVGQHIANKALDFVPFGLGGMIGRNAGESAGRAATRKAIEPALPTMEVVQATSDISFNTLDELAVYMYAKNSSHPQYARVLALAQRVYPDLQQTYADAIERASHSRSAKGKLASAESQKEKSPKERLKSLQKLKMDGLISESEYQAKRSKIIEEM